MFWKLCIFGELGSESKHLGAQKTEVKREKRKEREKKKEKEGVKIKG